MRIGRLDCFENSQQRAGAAFMFGDSLIDQQFLVRVKYRMVGGFLGGTLHCPSLAGGAYRSRVEHGIDPCCGRGLIRMMASRARLYRKEFTRALRNTRLLLNPFPEWVRVEL